MEYSYPAVATRSFEDIENELSFVDSVPSGKKILVLIRPKKLTLHLAYAKKRFITSWTTMVPSVLILSSFSTLLFPTNYIVQAVKDSAFRRTVFWSLSSRDPLSLSVTRVKRIQKVEFQIKFITANIQNLASIFDTINAKNYRANID